MIDQDPALRIEAMSAALKLHELRSRAGAITELKVEEVLDYAQTFYVWIKRGDAGPDVARLVPSFGKAPKS